MPQWQLFDYKRQAYPAILEKLSLSEANSLNSIGWEKEFNWPSVILDPAKGLAQKLVTISDLHIQGALSYRHDENFIFVDLFESAPTNRFTNSSRIYTNVTDILLGCACLESLNSPTAESYIAFDSKTFLMDYYEKRFGAKRIRSQQMLLYPPDSMRLVSLYYK